MTAFIFVALVTAFAVAALLRPATAFAAIICLYGIQQWSAANDPFFSNQLIINVSVALIVGSALGVKLLRRENPLRHYPTVAWLSFALYGYAFLTVFWTVAPANLLENFSAIAPRTLVILVLVPLLVTKTSDVRDAVHAAIAFGFVVLLLLWFNTRLREGPGALELQSAASGRVYGNYLELGSLAGRVGLLALFTQVGRWRRTALVGRVLVLGFAIMVLVMSTARGQMGAFVLAAAAVIPLNFRLRRMGIAGVAIAALLFVLAGQWAYDTLSGLKRFDIDVMQRNVAADRIDTSLTLLQTWWEGDSATVFFGLGNSAAYKILGTYPHFTALEVLGEEGLVGATLFATIIVSTVRSFWRGYRLVRDDDGRRAQTCALFSLFIFDVITSSKQGSLLGDSIMFTFAILASRYVLLVQADGSHASDLASGRPPTAAVGGLRLAASDAARQAVTRVDRPQVD
ncbi:MAG: hypothetical protein IT373_14170 [Polyangiaceae bacterium]|nr:hypothetical protein [Polyangiaceae bacterium]